MYAQWCSSTISSLTPTTAGFPHQLGEVSSESMPGDHLLGFVVNSLQMVIRLPEEKLQNIISDCRRVLRQATVSVRDLARVIGRMTAAIQAITPAPPCYRNLQRLKNVAFKDTQSFESRVPLDGCAKEELQWWIAEIHQWNGKPIVTPTPHMTIETDASLLGWGATLDGVATGGLWTKEERRHHIINWLELQGGAFAVKTFAKDKTNIHIRLKMDNTSAIAYINRLGGRGPKPYLTVRVNFGNGVWTEGSHFRRNTFWEYSTAQQTGSLALTTPQRSGNWTQQSAPKLYNDWGHATWISLQADSTTSCLNTSAGGQTRTQWLQMRSRIHGKVSRGMPSLRLP